MASICNDEWACFGVMSGHDRKTLNLSVRRVDRNLLWLNDLFLMVLAFVPAPTALIGEYPDAPLGSVVYGVVMAMAGLSFLAMRAYVTHHGSLLCEAIPPAAARQAMRKGWISPLL
jgi:uncharacterized membrane protein